MPRSEGHRPTGRRTLVTLLSPCSVGEWVRGQAAVHVSLDLCIICGSSRLSRRSLLPTKSTIRCTDDKTYDLGRGRKLHRLVLLSLPVGRGCAAPGEHRRRTRL